VEHCDIHLKSSLKNTALKDRKYLVDSFKIKTTKRVPNTLSSLHWGAWGPTTALS